jgi:hypothetical protein
MGILANTIAIASLTIAALQLVDAEYLPATLLAIAGAVAYLTRHKFPLPGED